MKEKKSASLIVYDQLYESEMVSLIHEMIIFFVIDREYFLASQKLCELEIQEHHAMSQIMTIECH